MNKVVAGALIGAVVSVLIENPELFFSLIKEAKKTKSSKSVSKQK